MRLDWLIVGPPESTEHWAWLHGVRLDRVFHAASADEMRLFDPTTLARVVLVDIARLAQAVIDAIAEEIRIIRIVWPEIRIEHPDVVAQIDAGLVPVLC